MERFRADGHLTDEALLALIRQEEQSELERLEIAEHLAFCDACLQRYTELLAESPLLTPVSSCTSHCGSIFGQGRHGCWSADTPQPPRQWLWP